MQWRAAMDGEPHPPSGFVTSVMATRDIAVHCAEEWTSLPADSIRRFERTAQISGLGAACSPMQFRVRARNYAGWGPYSLESDDISTHPGVHQPPVVCSLVTFFGVELRWPSLVHWDTSQKIHYTLTITPDAEKMFRAPGRPPPDPLVFEVGLPCKFRVGYEGEEPLWPKTEYTCVVSARAVNVQDSEPVASIPVIFSTLIAPPPEPPPAPVMVAGDSRMVDLEWDAATMRHPAAQRFPAKQYFLYGKEAGPGKRFVLLYSGPECSFSVGPSAGAAPGGGRGSLVGSRTGERGGEQKEGSSDPLGMVPQTQYSFRLSAGNDFGRSEFSDILTVRTTREGEMQDVDRENRDRRRRRGASPELAGSSISARSSPQNNGELGTGEWGEGGLSPTGGTGDGGRGESGVSGMMMGGGNKMKGATHNVVLSNGWVECWIAEPEV